MAVISTYTKCIDDISYILHFSITDESSLRQSFSDTPAHLKMSLIC